MSQQKLEVRDVDRYISFECANCGTDYQFPVRQWKGREEVVIPSMNCMCCGKYVWMATNSTDILELRKKLAESWGHKQEVAQ